MRLQGKVALITGASRGIGRALAIGFAQEGAQVVVSARTMEQGSDPKIGSLEDTVLQIAEIGRTALAMPCDVSNEIHLSVHAFEVVTKQAYSLKSTPLHCSFVLQDTGC